ncbi:fumarylacetoacetate hydrolase family protein [Ammonicoccus fulvus]|uniref:Fumarylacetoacetate hydrolase family protein n=1 Tax=Ammonicoccus fulvus TaxID=3138240 RepID=A0ABZ3FKZ6_9ACTN
MKLATVRVNGEARAARITDDAAILLDAADVGELLTDENWAQRAAADGESISLDGLDYLPVIPRPDKIVCLGLNYATHIAETGRETPEFPTLFGKYSGALTGAYADITKPHQSETLDWECELALVIGKGGRDIRAEDALDHIAGYTVSNDVTVREWQRRTRQYLAGKTWEALTPLGPWLVTSDELPPGASGLKIETIVDGEVMQSSNTSDLLFDVPAIVAYTSEVISLKPGDVILTGTPGGVGNARDPKIFLKPGQLLETVIEKVGHQKNRIV